MVTASVTNPLRGDKAWAYLERQKTIRLASLNEDGSIYLSPTWYVVEDQKMYLPFDAASRHGDNALSNRKIAGLVDAGDEFVTVSGLRIMGHLEQVTDDAHYGRLQDLMFHKYFHVGHPYAEQYFEFGDFAGRRYFHFVIDKMIGWDMRETTMPALPEFRQLPAHATDRILG
jgi:hypothetical protein